MAATFYRCISNSLNFQLVSSRRKKYSNFRHIGSRSLWMILRSNLIFQKLSFPWFKSIFKRLSRKQQRISCNYVCVKTEQSRPWASHFMLCSMKKSIFFYANVYVFIYIRTLQEFQLLTMPLWMGPIGGTFCLRSQVHEIIAQVK